ncbi:hypothetical protein DTW90_04040 [Neorhizobium sp. P12A]|jgi:hypothetical protein|nr:hypothetical protein DTW90_04040 [Neorhizobium sp. P12A]TCR91774.1 hypothetical protein EV561_102218 [Rhizobium sp. BK376]
MPNKQTNLRRVLQHADYATSDMEPSHGNEHHEDMMIIRRIRAATISPADYPRTRRQKRNADPGALAAWENEGGALRKT